MDIIIVSGLPRSGTSMMMQMLSAGGVEPLTDGLREADEDNPKGYYEYEKVKWLKRDQSWLGEAKGKAVKVVSGLLKHLLQDYVYKVIFMHRDLEEIVASQRAMLVRRGEEGAEDEIEDSVLIALLKSHLEQVCDWIIEQPISRISFIFIGYGDLLENPLAHIGRIDRFLGGYLDVNKMIDAIDPSLHRQQRIRQSERKLIPEMLEYFSE